MKSKMTYKELQQKILAILPEAEFEEDYYGQIIIYTNLTKEEDGKLTEFDMDWERYNCEQEGKCICGAVCCDICDECRPQYEEYEAAKMAGELDK